MSSADAWMPLVIGDYLGATEHLSMEQSGSYLHLLMHQWRRGVIPAGENLLAKICRCTPARWRSHIAPVILPFFTLVDGRLMQMRLARERGLAREKSHKAADSASTRWSKNRGVFSTISAT